MDKAVIKRNFSRCAPYYDRYSTIQNLCASRLISKIHANAFDKILDIGCGTGNYTKFLKRNFPDADIKAVDISSQMIKIAKQKFLEDEINFIIGDAELIEFGGKFNLITSNASFQWFENLEKALLKYGNLLFKDGFVLFSTFGPLTFMELKEALKLLLGRSPSFASSKFFDKTKIERIMKIIFKEVEIESWIYHEKYPSLLELFKKIKYTGTKGNGINEMRFWTPKSLKELEKIYIKRFGDIITSYEAIFCKGMK